MEWLRDLAIVVLGFGVTIVTVVLGVIAIMLYVKIQPVLKSAKLTTKRVENISATIEEEVVRPLAETAAAVQGLRHITGILSRFKGKR